MMNRRETGGEEGKGRWGQLWRGRRRSAGVWVLSARAHTHPPQKQKERGSGGDRLVVAEG